MRLFQVFETVRQSRQVIDRRSSTHGRRPMPSALPLIFCQVHFLPQVLWLLATYRYAWARPAGQADQYSGRDCTKNLGSDCLRLDVCAHALLASQLVMSSRLIVSPRRPSVSDLAARTARGTVFASCRLKHHSAFVPKLDAPRHGWIQLPTRLQGLEVWHVVAEAAAGPGSEHRCRFTATGVCLHLVVCAVALVSLFTHVSRCLAFPVTSNSNCTGSEVFGLVEFLLATRTLILSQYTPVLFNQSIFLFFCGYPRLGTSSWKNCWGLPERHDGSFFTDGCPSWRPISRIYLYLVSL